MTFDEALDLLHRGSGERAEQALSERVENARRTFGEASVEHVAALSDLAQLRMATGDHARAIAPLEEAARLRPPGPEGERQRLTMNMNLGDVLARASRPEDAEAVLREGLADRLAFYGEDHAGYAYGLEALATVLHKLGKNEEALRLADAAIDIFAQNGNPRIASALATRAPIAHAALGGSAFQRADILDDAEFGDLVSAVLANDGTAADARTRLGVLQELSQVRMDRFAGADRTTTQIFSAIANAARRAKDDEARITAYHWLQQILDSMNDAEGAFEATLGLALADDEAGDVDSARRDYDDALERSYLLGASARIRARRNAALFAASQGDHARASLLFAEGAATVGGGTEVVRERARLEIAYGIYLQHQGDNAAATEVLERALPLLPLADADALAGRSHLRAMSMGGACGCGSMDDAIGEAIAAAVKSKLPEGLVKHVRITIVPQKAPDVSVELAREATASELALLRIVVPQAVAELQMSIAARGDNPLD